MIRGELNQRQLKQMRARLTAAELPPKKRQRLMWRIAKLGIIVAAKRNQRNQIAPDGTPWAPRKRGKGKMLRGLPKLLAVREMPEIQGVRIYLKGGNYRNGARPVAAGLVGAAQQDGTRVLMKASSAPRKSQANRQALPRQAKKLRALGYKVRQGKRWVKPSAKSITASMSMAQAGLLIKKLRGAPVKRTWTIDLPGRVFLGVSNDEFNKILARQLQAIGFGWDVNAQDIRG
ncbi:hypothetical protein [Erwinia pyrifoliae]|uniref:Phage protein n=1 Tax=Erwinia pyrifoliae TaxID=79967 RepID=A0ABY5XCT2_ERWPY|nr:hypothetical protein [Erwinia pyrifoliae]MCT2387306.1 hypothetical protein [Erwinia pyrifoliae]MCU8587094.1 hypothetical protein [Erwinia pyrifoliae]UWS30957.1 hypothetical protein NYP81_05735 [Erwinia pyrifoliae]UWS35245.1 hypothetical protein NYP84_08945 [Erwinia pyrifoliae]